MTTTQHTPTAQEVNGAVRAEIVTMLGCMGRKHLVEAAKVDPLVDVIGLIFAELNEADAEAQNAPKLREHINGMERRLADIAEMPRQMAELNRRLAKANAEADELRLRLAKAEGSSS